MKPLAEITHDETQKNNPMETVDNITVSQSHLHLDHEAIQYKITFYENDNVSVAAKIILPQVDYKPKACMIVLSDGNKSIFQNKTLISATNIPTGSILDVTVLKHRIILGGKLLDKLFAMTSFHLGVISTGKQTIKVNNGSTWFLTIVQLTDKPEQTADIVFQSSKKSMNITEIDRTDNMGYCVSNNGDFEGTYIGFKIPFTPLGFSIARKLHKEVMAQKE